MSNMLMEPLREIGAALRRPDQLAVRWRDRAEHPEDAPTPAVFTALMLSAIFGLVIYGSTMGLHAGPHAMLLAAGKAPLACGLAWTLSLPALHILNAARGGKMDLSTSVLVALITSSFGAMAMLAAAPVNWFFAVAVDVGAVRYLVNFTIFGGVGIAMADVFIRTMRATEPDGGISFPLSWLAMLAILGLELHVIFDLFNLS